MMFEDFIKKGLVKNMKKEAPLVKSLIKNVHNDLVVLRKMRIDDLSSRIVMINYYNSLRIILEAIAIDKGYKIYSHEAFTYLLKEMDEDLLAIKFDRFRKIRNKLVYYGKNISKDETQDNIKEINKIIKVLKDKYLKEL